MSVPVKPPFWSTLMPPAEHPLWKIVQTVVSVLGVSILAYHGVTGLHETGVDVSEVAGVGGAAVGSKLVYQWLKQP